MGDEICIAGISSPLPDIHGLPDDITDITVRGLYLQPDDQTPCRGSVDFELSTTMSDPGSNVIIPPVKITQKLDRFGVVEVVLAATDNPNVDPTSGLVYRVTERIYGAPEPPRSYYIQVPRDSPMSVIDLADVAPAMPGVPYYTYALESALLAHEADPSAHQPFLPTLAGTNTWTGNNVFDGNETHGGIETHGGPADFTGALTHNSLPVASSFVTTATKTTNYTALPWDFVLCDCTSGSFTVTLPTGATAGQTVAVRRLTSTSVNTVSVARGGSDTINGSTTSLTISLNNEVLWFTKDAAANWNVSAGQKSLASLDDRFRAFISVLPYGAIVDLSHAAGSITTNNAAITSALAAAGSGGIIYIPYGVPWDYRSVVQPVEVQIIDYSSYDPINSAFAGRTREFFSTASPWNKNAYQHIVSGNWNTAVFARNTNPGTTIAVGSNGLTLPQATINVVATGVNFPPSGNAAVTTSNGPQTVAYTGITGTTLTGCTGGTGTMSTGGAVYPPRQASFYLGLGETSVWGFNMGAGNALNTDLTIIGNSVQSALQDLFGIGRIDSTDVGTAAATFGFNSRAQPGIDFFQTGSGANRATVMREVTHGTNGFELQWGNHANGQRIVTDGVTTNGSPTVTSATAAFSTGAASTDLFDSISGAGIPANSYIGVVNSATSIGLSSSSTSNIPVNASISASGVSVTIGASFVLKTRFRFNDDGSILFNNAISASPKVGPNGDLLFSTDNALDIGKSGATRPRDIFSGRDVSVGRHVVAVGPVPTITAGAAAGASPPAPVGANTNDIRGVVTFGSGTGPTKGEQVVVTYSAAYAVQAVPVISPVGDASFDLGLEVGTASQNGFTVYSRNAPQASEPNTFYAFTYAVIG